MVETDVLVVGGGPTGASSALFLARHGMNVLLVTKNTRVSDTPRAHITNQRTMEIMRNVGLEEACYAKASDHTFMANSVWVTTLAGEELGRLLAWGNDPARRGDYELASPAKPCDLPQWYFEPILLGEAERLGAAIRFGHELTGFTQDGEGVRATVVERGSGHVLDVRAKYLVAGDGGRSRVAEALGLPLSGEAGLGTAINVLFHADLSRLVAHRPGSIWSVFDHGHDELTGGYATLRMVRPWSEWLAMFPETSPDADIDEPTARRIIEGMIGDPAVAIDVQGVSRWQVNKVIAERYSSGRVFCAGDAVHRHPPWNGLGSNTAVQDSWNLAWKMALVLRGQASPSLLETYTEERQPVGRRVVERAIKSLEGGRTLVEVLGVKPGQTAAERRRVFDSLKAPGEEGARRRREWRSVVESRNYVYNALGVELNQTYRSAAVVPDGTPEPAFGRDPELHCQSSTWPGSRLPHCWLERDAQPVSVQDLCGHERFTLLTGIGGGAWKEVAAAVTRATGVPVEVCEIGLGLPVKDPYGDWRRLSEVEEDGCVLVRPDLHVGWRCSTLVPQRLAGVFRRMLGWIRADATADG